LKTIPPVNPAAAWATAITGVNPGRHGILHIRQFTTSPAINFGNHAPRVSSKDIRAPLLWEYFDKQGYVIGNINQPLSYPLRSINGFAISGMFTPPQADDWIHPADMIGSLNNYIIELDFAQLEHTSDTHKLTSQLSMLDNLLRMTERRGMHSLRFMKNREWDVFSVVFTGVGHIFRHFWHYLHPDAPISARRIDIRIADKLQTYFDLMDQLIGAMIQMAGKEVYILLYSAFGYRRAARYLTHLNNWLLDLDLLRLQTEEKEQHAGKNQQRRRILRDPAKRVLSATARQAIERYGSLDKAIDWNNTLAWAAPLDANTAGVFLHHTHYKPPGPISPAAASGLCDFISAQASALRIPGKDAPLILKIQTKEDVYHGPHTVLFPDLLLTLDPDHIAVSDLGSTLIRPIPPAQRLHSGERDTMGMFLAAGPSIHPEHFSDPISILDLVPSILHLNHIPIPKIMDGRALSNRFS
jgi:predicted AlkP superfamily phosphohydrolase/phosphomutase